MKFAALTAVAAVSMLGIAAYALVNMDGNRSAPITPATSDTPTSEETPTPIPSENLQARGDCSAGDSQVRAYDWPVAEIPDEVEQMRNEIIVAAIACDYDKLESLALQDGEGFGYSYGVEDSPSSFWRDREREHPNRPQTDFPGYMEGLVSVLDMPYCKESNDDGTGTNTLAVYYVWPRVHCAGHRTADDWNDLKGLYTDEHIEEMRTNDLYYGFRVGIRENGDWEYFIAGD
jgi:hypothetical protein